MSTRLSGLMATALLTAPLLKNTKVLLYLLTIKDSESFAERRASDL